MCISRQTFSATWSDKSEPLGQVEQRKTQGGEEYSSHYFSWAMSRGYLKDGKLFLKKAVGVSGFHCIHLS